jgi:hypothetical protein
VLAGTISTLFPPARVSVVANLSVVAPLFLACAAIIVAVPVAAAKSKLHIPGYVGFAFLSFVIGLLLGKVAGARGITGTLTGLFLSIIFSLLIATAVGCVLALFFYRHPEL